MSKHTHHCEQLKQLLVKDGMAAVERARQNETALAGHLRNCAGCRKLLQAWQRIPDLLEQLPEHEPDEKLLHKVRQAAASGQRPRQVKRRRFLAPSLASAAVLLAAIGISRELLIHESPVFPATPARQQTTGELLSEPVSAPPPAPTEPQATHPLHAAERSRLAPQAGAGKRDSLDGLDESFDYRGDDAAFFDAQKSRREGKEADRLELSGSRARDAGAVVDFEAGLESPAEEIRRNQVRQKADLKDLDNEYNLQLNQPVSGEYEKQAAGRKSLLTKKEVPETEALPASIVEGFAVGGALASAQFDFLAHYRQTGNLQFQPANGYWANTYIPGDPEIRLLSARLAQWDRSWLADNAALEQEVAPVQQPFDAPADNALALSLMADASAVSGGANGVNRLRLQVGIRGIEHRRGQRPAMNVGVVIDLPADAPDEVRIATRALLDALLESKQAGDQFSLVIADSGLVVEAEEFRFGPLQLARQHILDEDSVQKSTAATSSGLELHAALQRAAAMVRKTDDPGRPLGSSSVLLISADTLPEIEQLTALAHDNAKEGVTLSVFPLGNQPQNDSVEKLVLAGLGNRRYLEAPGQARQLIETELHASSRAVARAARLSIRLAPGVRLINVVGSERLDTRRSQRVRDIENSMDRRLSANLGIQADRGEDEDGIQIVIPGIFSGDSVTVLLDVVTDRPGAIADVSLRYKDLVFLRNGSLQGHLELPAGENEPGPAELAVLKNLLSHHFIEAVEQAAAALGRGQPAEAIAVLNNMRNTLEQARRNLPAWANDPDLIRDQQVLDRYIAALASPQSGAHQPFLADSLRYAAWAKTHRPLPENFTRSGPNERSQ